MLYSYSADLGTVIDKKKLCEVNFNFPLVKDTVNEAKKQIDMNCLKKVVIDTLVEYEEIVKDIDNIHKELTSNHFNYILKSVEMINKLTNFNSIKAKAVINIEYKSNKVKNICSFITYVSANAVYSVFKPKEHKKLMEELNEICSIITKLDIEDTKECDFLSLKNMKTFGADSRNGESIFHRVRGHILELKEQGYLDELGI